MNNMFGLNDGFSALKESFCDLEIKQIRVNQHQARKVFDEEEIRSLAASIEKIGIQSPVIVRMDGFDFELIAGERRLRAFKLLGRTTIPAFVSAGDSEEISLAENLQRTDLNVTELAFAFDSMSKRRGMTHEDIGKIAGLSGSAVTRIIGVLGLPTVILDEYPAYVEIVSRSVMIELQDVRDEKDRLALWELAKTGTLTREEIRSKVKQVRQEKAAANGGKKPEVTVNDVKKLARTINSIKANVLALDGQRDLITKEHLDTLVDLRARIDDLIAGKT
jgi:ParB family chromosome partitioning protein